MTAPTTRLLRIAAITAAALLFACTTIRPQTEPDPAATSPAAGVDGAAFDHAEFDRVLAAAVDDRGRVDYAGLARDPGELPAYFAALARTSPDSAPGRFPTREHELAYWLNAYNAVAIQMVLAAYPIESVLDVKNPRALFFLPRLAGFFVFRRFELGGDPTSLYFLENDIVRVRYGEPRIHFALNCASASCPRLPNEAFLRERLEAQLEREARRFFAEKRNLEVDPGERTVHLSAILDWYRDDYLDWLEREHPELPRTLLSYASLHAPADVKRQLAGARDYEVVFRPYDWSLNDQALPDPFASD